LSFKDWKNLLEFIPLHFCPYGQKWSGEFARKNKKILSLLEGEEIGGEVDDWLDKKIEISSFLSMVRMAQRFLKKLSIQKNQTANNPCFFNFFLLTENLFSIFLKRDFLFSRSVLIKNKYEKNNY